MRFSVLTRRDAIAVDQRPVDPSGQKRIQHGLVIRAAVAQHHRLHHRRPGQIVNMIERRTRTALPDQKMNIPCTLRHTSH